MYCLQRFQHPLILKISAMIGELAKLAHQHGLPKLSIKFRANQVFK